ncbi:MAG TPA: type IV pili methyl-accepting chemotaxis transducer N-terminal domain-containing protein [Burkholderiaceae bacterium]|jgi:two-component system nitrate/nitrite sensor histidine kinase NarX|nr:type IV pili methyl-accepting chemotaxis transducer N-terminal domain-containing protein [Burkholderiaceae bacterium]
MTEFLSNWQRLSTKIVGALLGFLLIALSAIGATLLLSWQLQGSSAAINEAGSLRMHSYRLTMMLSRVVNEPEQPATRTDTAQVMVMVDQTFARLQRGDPQRPLYLPPTQKIHTEFERIYTRWQKEIRPLANTVLQLGPLALQGDWQRYLSQVDSFVTEANGVVQLIERDSERRTFWLRSSQLMLVAMALIGTVMMIYLMFLLIIQPVSRLQEGMERMTKKDFSVRLPVYSKDEFGQLALGFNEMSGRLEELYSGLEERVKQKTAELGDQNRELALLYDSAAFLQRPQPVESLCDGFLQRISEYFKADGGSVRTLDTSRGNLHMVAHRGMSKELVESEQCMKVGECLCGEAILNKDAVVHDLRLMDRACGLKCYSEGFATISIFHIHAHEQHLGLFNLHFRKAKVFSKREMALLETLGQLLGVAIENVRLATREREMAISEERNLVAQGLHDSIAQGLTFLNIQVQMLEESLHHSRMAEVGEIVPALKAGVKESYEDVRELLVNFRSRLAEGNLVRSLETTFDKFRRQTGIDVNFASSGNGAPFPREQQLQILFIVQEALSNIRKHAGACKVEVRLDDQQDFDLTIHDDGVGFDAETLLQKGENHVGIAIMRERAQRIQASFSVASAINQGTTVSLQLPRQLRRAA